MLITCTLVFLFIAVAECGPSNWGAGCSGTVQGADEVPDGKGPGAAEQAVLWVQWGAKWAGGGAGGRHGDGVEPAGAVGSGD